MPKYTKHQLHSAARGRVIIVYNTLAKAAEVFLTVACSDPTSAKEWYTLRYLHRKTDKLKEGTICRKGGSKQMLYLEEVPYLATLLCSPIACTGAFALRPYIIGIYHSEKETET